MATDEEYLDSLLKSMTEAEQSPRNMEDVIKSMNMEVENIDNNSDDVFSLSTDDLADMLDKIEENEDTHPVIEEIRDEVSTLYSDPVEMPVFQDVSDDIIMTDDSSDETVVDDDFISKLIAQQEALEQAQGSDDNEVPGNAEDEVQTQDGLLVEEADVDLMSLLTSENNEWDTVSPAISEESLENMDVTELIDTMEETQNDLLEINDLLKKADSNEYVEVDNADMMALLGAMQGEEISEDSVFWGNDDVSGLDEAGFPEELLGIGEKPEPKEKKKKRKDKESKKGLFGKKDKKAKASNKKADGSDAIDAETDAKKQSDGKKPGRLAQFFTYLTQEEDEADENTEILNQLELEDAEKAKSKKKKADKANKKKAGKGSKKEKSADKAEKAAKKQEKKALREQKKQEKRANQPIEPNRKVLSKKGMIVLIAFCASIIAAVFALSTFLPDYVDKKEAREAFYIGDYETVYKLLYGKQLDNNDRLIYERVEMVLSLQRKLDAYENNKILGRDAEALEALLEGVERYHELEGAAELGAQSEVDAIYNQMCGILLNNYGLTGEDALTIAGFDDIAYSRTVYNLISGIGFVKQGEETAVEENLTPQDILPEEEEIIDLN